MKKSCDEHLKVTRERFHGWGNHDGRGGDEVPPSLTYLKLSQFRPSRVDETILCLWPDMAVRSDDQPFCWPPLPTCFPVWFHFKFMDFHTIALYVPPHKSMSWTETHILFHAVSFLQILFKSWRSYLPVLQFWVFLWWVTFFVCLPLWKILSVKIIVFSLFSISQLVSCRNQCFSFSPMLFPWYHANLRQLQNVWEIGSIMVIMLCSYTCFYSLYFVKLSFFFIGSNVIPNLYIGKRWWMKSADTWHYPHLPICLSHYPCYTSCGCFMSIYLDAFSRLAENPFDQLTLIFFICKSRHLPLLYLSQVVFLIKWELGYGCAFAIWTLLM